MKWAIGGALVGAVVLSGCMGTAPVKRNELPVSATNTVFGHAIPAGAPVSSQAIVTSKYVSSNAKLSAEPWRVAHFRPNISMPEYLLGDSLLEMAETNNPAQLQRRLENSDTVVVALPRLNILPCDQGCIGAKGYQKAVEKFEKTYYAMAEHKSVAFRGTMNVKVRWFVEKSFVQRVNPLSMQDEVFAIQFPVEGNVLTISAMTSGKDSSVIDSAAAAGRFFRLGVVTPMAFGLRNFATIRLSPEYEPGSIESLNNWGAGIAKTLRTVMGKDDYRSRFETPDESHQVLFPAVDGIEPGEGRKLEATHYFESL